MNDRAFWCDTRWPWKLVAQASSTKVLIHTTNSYETERLQLPPCQHDHSTSSRQMLENNSTKVSGFVVLSLRPREIAKKWPWIWKYMCESWTTIGATTWWIRIPLNARLCHDWTTGMVQVWLKPAPPATVHGWFAPTQLVSTFWPLALNGIPNVPSFAGVVDYSFPEPRLRFLSPIPPVSYHVGVAHRSVTSPKILAWTAWVVSFPWSPYDPPMVPGRSIDCHTDAKP